MDIKAKFRDKVSKLLFLEMDRERLKRFFNIELSESVYMPLKSSSLYERIEKNESLEEVNLGFFIEGMVYVLGGDPSIKFNGKNSESPIFYSSNQAIFYTLTTSNNIILTASSGHLSHLC